MRPIAVSSDASNPADAVIGLGAALRAAGVNPRNHPDAAALVFASTHHAEHPEALGGALQDLLGNVPFIGWIGRSVFHSLRLAERHAGLVLLFLPNARAYVRVVEAEGLGSEVAGALTADAPLGLARFLSSPHDHFDGPNLLPSLDEQGVPILGALNSAPAGVPSTALGPYMDGMVPCTTLMSVDGYRMVVGLGQAARPLGPGRTITATRGNLVEQVDGRPALNALMEDLPPKMRDSLQDLRGSLFAGLGTSDDSVFLMRSVIGVDPRSGAVAVAGDPRPESTLLFALRDGRSARDDLEQLLHNLKTALGDKTPAAILLFDCVARDETLFNVQNYDVGRLEDVFGAECPVVGVAAEGRPSRRTHEALDP